MKTKFVKIILVLFLVGMTCALMAQEEIVVTANEVAFTMKYVEGDRFIMGAQSFGHQWANFDTEAAGDETPPHFVTVSSFYMAETEVTQGLWEAVMGTTVEQQRDKANPEWPLRGVGANYPMYYVSWDDCQAFVEKLSGLTGKKFRLPTEAEWEFAARGGKMAKGDKYAGSKHMGLAGWYYMNSASTSHPVKEKAANELGLYDMSGNVWEWCSDWYARYDRALQTDPQGPATGVERVLRGGGWAYYASRCRVSFRYKFDPEHSNSSYGFRIVMVAGTSKK